MDKEELYGNDSDLLYCTSCITHQRFVLKQEECGLHMWFKKYCCECGKVLFEEPV